MIEVFTILQKKPSDVRFKNKIKSIVWHSTHEKLEIPMSSIEVIESVCLLGADTHLTEQKIRYYTVNKKVQ